VENAFSIVGNFLGYILSDIGGSDPFKLLFLSGFAFTMVVATILLSFKTAQFKIARTRSRTHD
jgi:F0F1-type ATP synthase assembly protein I